jgi:hypothetical protein
MKLEDSSLCSQEPATGRYTKKDEYSQVFRSKLAPAYSV